MASDNYQVGRDMARVEALLKALEARIGKLEDWRRDQPDDCAPSGLWNISSILEDGGIVEYDEDAMEYRAGAALTPNAKAAEAPEDDG